MLRAFPRILVTLISFFPSFDVEAARLQPLLQGDRLDVNGHEFQIRGNRHCRCQQSLVFLPLCGGVVDFIKVDATSPVRLAVRERIETGAKEHALSYAALDGEG